MQYYLSYAFVDATYQSDETLASVTEPNGVQVRSGDCIPGIPQHNLKVGAEVAVLDNLWLGADVIAASGSYLRGDEGNRQPKLDGYYAQSRRPLPAHQAHRALGARRQRDQHALRDLGRAELQRLRRPDQRRAIRRARRSDRRLGGRARQLLSARARPGQAPVERLARRQIPSQSLSANTQITPP